MALLYQTATDERCHTADNAVTNLDSDTMTFAFHFWKDDNLSNRWSTGTVVSLGNRDVWQEWTTNIKLHYDGDTQPPIQFESFFSTTNANHETAADLPVDQWNGVALSYDRSDPGTSPSIYVNGVADTWVIDTNGSGSPETASGIAADNDTVGVGILVGGSQHFADAGAPADGRLAEVAVWTRQLSDPELAALSNGFAPTFFMDGLVFYMPMYNTTYDNDVIGPYAMDWEAGPTNSGDHPEMIYPSAPQTVIQAAAAGPATAIKDPIGVGVTPYPR